MKAFLTVVTLSFLLFGCAKKQVVSPTPPAPPLAEERVAPKEVPKAQPKAEALEPVTYPGVEGEVWRTPLLKTIYFDFDRYDLRPDAKRTLEENARVLKEHPTWYILIEGHCDERGSNEYNLALGEKRAKAAMEYLIMLGIEPERLSIISYGEERPVDPRHNEEAWAKNRRCEFVVMKR